MLYSLQGRRAASQSTYGQIKKGRATMTRPLWREGEKNNQLSDYSTTVAVPETVIRPVLMFTLKTPPRNQARHHTLRLT